MSKNFIFTLPFIRLKEFKTKKIKDKETKESKLEKDDLNNFKDNENMDKQRLLSATSSVGLRSTFYTANQTQSKFPTPWTTGEIQLDPLREVKSSFSYLRPKHDFSNLMIEKTTMQAKHRELAEKRNQEEMKEFMNEFGLSKARFNEEVEKKYDTKRIVRHYENEIRKEDSGQEEYEEEEEEEPRVKTVFLEDEKSLQKLRKELGNDRVNFTKVNNCNIKNLGADNKISGNPNEVRVNIKLKDRCSNTKSTWNIFAGSDKVPSEVTARMKSVDPIFNARQTYSKMLEIKEIDNPKTDYINHYNPLSAYDSSNVHVMSISPLKSEAKIRPKTGYEFVRDTFENDNLLKQRKTLTNFKLNDYTKLKNTLIKYNNTGVCFASLKSAFSPAAEEIQYPKFFLPNPGYGILSRPAETVTKKRVRSSKKKKK